MSNRKAPYIVNSGQPLNGRAVVNQSQTINSLRMSNRRPVLASSLGMPTNSWSGGNTRMQAPHLPVTNINAGNVTSAIQNSSGPSIILPQSNHQMNSQQELAASNVYPLPPSITIQVASATGGAAIRVYVFNQDAFNNITNNGAGAGSVTYTYQDGFSGAVTNRMIGLARAGMGVTCYGVAIRMVVTASRAGDPIGLGTALPRFDVFNLLGSSLPTNFNITANQGRGDFDSSIEVMPVIQNITYFTQFSFVIPTGDTATCTFYFTPDYNG